MLEIENLSSEELLRKGDIVELNIESLAFGGQGIARVHDMVVFINNTLPGQTIKAKIIKKKKNFAEAKMQEILHQSPHFQQPQCIHFGVCGGCSMQNMDYNQQLYYKRQQVLETLEKLGGFREIEVQPILASTEIFYYRNKMEFSFSPCRWLTEREMSTEQEKKQDIYLGLHVKNFYEKIVDIEVCHLLAPITNDILVNVRNYARKSGLPAYNTKEHNGFWRFLVIRHCKNTNDLMVNLVTYEYDQKVASQFTQLIKTRFPQVTSLLYSTTHSASGVAYGEEEYLLSGTPTISENLGGYQFDISSNSFFQTNTHQAEQLYKTIAHVANIQHHEVVYDLYCGAGTISIFLNRFANRIVGYEAIAATVANAVKNAKHNNVNNCIFIQSDLRDLARDSEPIISLYGKPDVMIIDPPRGGMHPKTVEAILHLRPHRIVYVSCNPATLARDLKLLCNQYYQLELVQPVDMFPHTYHIEVVTKLGLKTHTNYFK